MDLGLSQKVALVTGASRGIGAAIALGLAAEGAAIAVNYQHSESEAAQVLTGIERLGSRGVLAQVDITRLDDVQAMVTSIQAQLGQIDILVNNAGISTHTRGIDGTTADDMAQCISVNVMGMLNCMKVVTPQMKERRYGKIVNIVSYRAYAPQTPSPYAASKAAALNVSIEAARELAPFNINVVSVSPGMIATDMLMARGIDSPEKLQHLIDQVPLGRLGSPDDVANLVCFLASDRSRHITGTDILITGGEMCRW